ERLEQRAADEVLAREQLVLGVAGADGEELARVVPVVEGVVDVDALVALQADEAGAGRGGERLRDLGLADARLALEQQRLLEAGGEEDGRRQPAVGEIALAGKGGGRLLRRCEPHVRVAASSARRVRTRATSCLDA